MRTVGGSDDALADGFVRACQLRTGDVIEGSWSHDVQPLAVLDAVELTAEQPGGGQLRVVRLHVVEAGVNVGQTFMARLWHEPVRYLGTVDEDLSDCEWAGGVR